VYALLIGGVSLMLAGVMTLRVRDAGVVGTGE
jgi:hypothetical protein